MARLFPHGAGCVGFFCSVADRKRSLVWPRGKHSRNTPCGHPDHIFNAMLKGGAESAQGGTDGARIALMLLGVFLDGDSIGVADFEQFSIVAADLAEAEV